MAFGKKKNEELALAAPQEDDAPPPVNLFEQDATEDDDEPAVELDQAPAAEEAPAPAEPLASPDALLSLFQESEDTSGDRSAMLELAGDVEMSDLIDDLRTLAAALRIGANAGA